LAKLVELELLLFSLEFRLLLHLIKVGRLTTHPLDLRDHAH
jgi:ribonuclease HII